MSRIVLELQGGLGNQLFQLAAAMKIAREESLSLIIDKSHFLRRSTRTYEMKVLEGPLKFKASYLVRLVTSRLPRVAEDVEFEPFNLKTKKAGDFRLKGYFQNSDQIRKECDQISSSLNQLFSKMSKISRETCCTLNHIGVHVRRGDYENIAVNSRNFGVLSDLYFLNIIKNLDPVKTHLVIFTESETITLIDLIPGNYRFSVSLNSGSSALTLLGEMSASDGFIMSNSSLSWWTANLIKLRKPDALIYAPNNWFRSFPKSNNLLQPNWIKNEAIWQ